MLTKYLTLMHNAYMIYQQTVTYFLEMTNQHVQSVTLY